MEHLLLAAHVLAGILFVGPVAVTTSLFPRFAPIAPAAAGTGDALTASAPFDTAPSQAHTASAGRSGPGGRSTAVARLLHRVTRVYGLLALIVPVVGLVLAMVQGRLGEVWITVAMVLTALAGGLLALRIAPAQREALDSPDDGTRLRALAVFTGIFNLLWAAVVVLMIVRPGAA
ncbi:membrane protein [Okibacterium endophyticum]